MKFFLLQTAHPLAGVYWIHMFRSNTCVHFVACLYRKQLGIGIGFLLWLMILWREFLANLVIKTISVPSC